MAHAVDSRATSPANDLRDALDRAEDLVVQPNAANIEEVLILLDRISDLFVEVEAAGVDLRPEWSRWESIRSRVAARPGLFASAAAGAGGMAKLRQKHPPAEHFWWHVDRAVAERRRQALKRMTTVLGSIIAVVLLVYWVLETFFPPSPETLLLLETEQNIDEAILAEDWEQARQIVEHARDELPNEPELWVWDMVLSEQLGDMGRAAESMTRAQKLLEERPLAFWITAGNLYLRVGNLDGAERAANRAVEIDPDEAQAYFLLANAAELRGDYQTAIAMFDKTFQLAENDNPQLAVISRVRMGTLLQRAGPFETPGTQESVAPTTPPTPQ
jgi:tetratricopeptide (TPR) repeat protein